MKSTLKAKSLLLRIKRPASIELHGCLPDCLDDGAWGGFHPCGMWNFIFDSRRLDWCGVQFYLQSSAVDMFKSSNVGMDQSMMRLRKVNDVYKDKESLDQCSRNSTSHVLQVVWSEAAISEIMPALEFSDFWYAMSGGRETAPVYWFSLKWKIGVVELATKGWNIGHLQAIVQVDESVSTVASSLLPVGCAVSRGRGILRRWQRSTAAS